MTGIGPEELGPDSVFDQAVIIHDVPLTGGCRNKPSARHINPNEAYELFNTDVEDPSKLQKRSGYLITPVGSIGMKSSSMRISGLAELNMGPASRLMVVAVPGSANGAVYYAPTLDSTTGWGEALVTKDVTGTVSRSLNVDTDDCTMIQGNGLLWIVPGFSQNLHVMETSGTLIDLGDEAGSPPRGVADATFLFERVWLFADGKLYWSKLLPSTGDLTPTPSAFIRTSAGSGSAGGVVNIALDRGGDSVAVKTWRNQRIICFFERHIKEFIPNSANPASASVLNMVEENFGCAAKNSIISVGDEIYFLDNYYDIRALGETISGTSRGMLRDAISEPIQREFPGRLNKAMAHKTRATILNGRVTWFYCRDGETELRHSITFDLATRTWVMAPAEYAHPFSQVFTSALRNGVPEMLAANGNATNPVSAVYRFDPTVYSDNGTAITMRPTLRQWDIGRPESAKQPKWARWAVNGDAGAEGTFRVRTADGTTYSDVWKTSVALNTNASFPLVDPDDFPVVDPTDFPLIDAVPQRTAERFPIDEVYPGDFPKLEADLPIFERDMPLYGGGFGVNRGEVVQVQFEESSTKNFWVDQFQLAVNVHKPGRID